MKSQTYGEEIYGNAVKHGFMPEEVKNEMLDKVVGLYDSASKAQMNDIVKIDSSLAAMQFMLVAKAHGYDTNPIGGFESDQIADAFDIDAERYVPVLIVAIGKAKIQRMIHIDYLLKLLQNMFSHSFDNKLSS